jgi:putative glycosyltransferase (TIGR04372 family)
MLAAEELAKRGYYVFRMGVNVEKKFISNNPKIIDYANSNLRSDFMDVYLGAKCSFCLSTGTGFDDVPYIFRRPIALIQCPFGNISTSNAYSEKFLIITKHHVLKKENRRLSLSEIFSHGVAYAYKTEIFNQKGIELVDNTPDEIKDLVVEMADNLEFKKQLNPEDEELQKTFRSLFASNFKSSVERYGYPRTNELFLFNEVRSSFSTKFLKENKNWLQ